MIETIWCAMCDKVHITKHGLIPCESIPSGMVVPVNDIHQTQTWCRNFDVGTFSTAESGWAALQQCIVSDHYSEFKRLERTRKLFNRMVSDSLWIADMR